MMKSSGRAPKSADRLKTTPANPDVPGAAVLSSPPVGATEPVGLEPAAPMDSSAGGVVQPSEKPKPARFDFAAANQAHLKSKSTMRGKNAGPVNKSPTRR